MYWKADPDTSLHKPVYFMTWVVQQLKMIHNFSFKKIFDSKEVYF